MQLFKEVLSEKLLFNEIVTIYVMFLTPFSAYMSSVYARYVGCILVSYDAYMVHLIYVWVCMHDCARVCKGGGGELYEVK